ncbi:hypothetical protein L596_006781 [Steinernema carpocapsae]|uniref:Uncharacterized protein n=1 Tax=Steinernema carpocapsae TaxID=34508 RepID=A0A4U5P6R2_STECR|nr:hypothetical protein L596_006781 [Steinernema carpocapsae]
MSLSNPLSIFRLAFAVSVAKTTALISTRLSVRYSGLDPVEPVILTNDPELWETSNHENATEGLSERSMPFGLTEPPEMLNDAPLQPVISTIESGFPEDHGHVEFRCEPEVFSYEGDKEHGAEYDREALGS